jgi:Transcriptional regulatory protein, C terminal
MDFRILGSLDVYPDVGAVALGGEKRRALLTMLLLHANEPISAERLAVSLWGEDAALEAVKTVRVHVSRIRAALGDPEALVTTPAGYQLRVRAGELDAARFEDLLERDGVHWPMARPRWRRSCCARRWDYGVDRHLRICATSTSRSRRLVGLRRCVGTRSRLATTPT